MTAPHRIQAGEIMSSPVIAVTGDTPTREAAKLMIEKNIGCVVVVDSEGRFEGLISERLFMPEEVPLLRDGLVVGMVSRHDMLRAFTEH